jgi:hypothetical protein
VLFRTLEDRVQPLVIDNPGEGALHHPADSSWKEFSVAATGDRFDGDAEFLPDLCQMLAPVAEIAQRGSSEPLSGEFTQHRHNAFDVVDIGRRDVDRQRNAMFLDAKWTFTPQMFLPPSKPRSKQLGADLQDLSPDSYPLADSERGLSITIALGSALSPQASRQVRRSRPSSRRHRPSRVQRENRVNKVLNGMS